MRDIIVIRLHLRLVMSLHLGDIIAYSLPVGCNRNIFKQMSFLIVL
jgi:hypothetical protein